MERRLSQAQIRHWLLVNRKHQEAGDTVSFFAQITRRTGISRQTLYNLIWAERISETTQTFRHLSRREPLKVSTIQFSVGLSGRLK